MKIRWLGAFGKNGSISDSLNYELSGIDSSFRAAEWIEKGTCGAIKHASVGLLVKNKAIARRYQSDVWSVRDGKRLRPTRWEHEAGSDHRECFARPEYCGIVLKSKNCGCRPITHNILRAVKIAAQTYNLPVLRLTKSGELEEVRINV
jgi:hypothetical protein